MAKRKLFNSANRKEEELPDSLKWDNVSEGIFEKMNVDHLTDGINKRRFRRIKWSLLLLLLLLSTCVYISKDSKPLDPEIAVLPDESKYSTTDILENKSIRTEHYTQTSNEKSKLSSSKFNTSNRSADSEIIPIDLNESVSSIPHHSNNTEVVDKFATINTSAIQHASLEELNSLQRDQAVNEDNYINLGSNNINENNLADEIHNKNKINSELLTDKNLNTQKSGSGNNAPFKSHLNESDKLIRVHRLPTQKCCKLLLTKVLLSQKQPQADFAQYQFNQRSNSEKNSLVIQQGIGTWNNSVFYFNQENTDLQYSNNINLNSYIGLTRNLGKNWNVEAGIRYSNLSGLISFYEEKDTLIQVEYVSQKRINSLTGEILGETRSTENVEALKWTNVKHSNTLRLLALPVFISREFLVSDKWKGNFGVGMEYGLLLSASGKWLSNNADIDDQQNIIVQLSNAQTNRHTFISTSKFGMHYKLKENMNIGFNMLYSNHLTNLSKNSLLILKPKSIFATIGLEFQL